ncbi:MAG: META domain-containing protein [Gammaproteobacteria bacterium]|nr:META domain-containing protein [Gammaproteobacteria bacterium]
MNVFREQLLLPLSLIFALTFFNHVIASQATDTNEGNMIYSGIYENRTVELKDGQWSGSPFVSGASSRATVGLINNFSFSGDMDGDGQNEKVVFLWENSGGSGTRVYMAVIDTKSGKPVNVATHLVGDRVQLVMGRVDKQRIELDVIQAGMNDAACCPTSKVLRTWSMNKTSNGAQLIENKPFTLGKVSIDDLAGRQWRLVKMKRREALPENITITMTYKAKKISGKSGCNRYFANITSGDTANDIIIEQVGTTRMACPKDVMEYESRFIKALSTVTSYSFVNGQLALSWKDNKVNSTMLLTAQ